MAQNVETEIKLRVSEPEAARALLKSHAYVLQKQRVFESNIVYDTPGQDVRRRGELLRIRRAGDGGLLTFKAPEVAGRHKSREELETRVENWAMLDEILKRLGFAPMFVYEKYREEYERADEPGVITLDETPVGVFLELEGPADWIDATAAELGFSESDYILSSYGALYREHCAKQGVTPTNMVFA